MKRAIPAMTVILVLIVMFAGSGCRQEKPAGKADANTVSEVPGVTRPAPVTPSTVPSAVLAGMNFVSKDKHETGRGGTVGHWRLSFSQATVSWNWSDVQETVKYAISPDGSIKTFGDRPIEGRYYPDRKELLWDGLWYRAE